MFETLELASECQPRIVVLRAEPKIHQSRTESHSERYNGHKSSATWMSKQATKDDEQKNNHKQLKFAKSKTIRIIKYLIKS